MHNQPAPDLARTLLAAVVLLASAGTLAADSPAAPDQPGCSVNRSFADATLADWQERQFEGNTDYRLIDDGPNRVLSAQADGTASVLYRQVKLEVDKTPLLQWSWSVAGVYDDIDEKTRGGDDFAARLYVVVKTGALPWNTLALNYVWASNLPVGENWPNPFTDKAHMVVVRSGDEQAGDWVCQSRDVVADFRTHFGVDVDRIDGYAVMVDGDNGDRRGQARFGDISFKAR